MVDASNLWRHIFMPAMNAADEEGEKKGGEEGGETSGETSEEKGDGGDGEGEGDKAGTKTPDGREEVLQQIAFADRVVLNKADLVDDKELIRATLAVRTVNPRAEVLKCEYGQVCGWGV